MMKIWVVALGAVDAEILAAVNRFLPHTFGLPVQTMQPFPEPAYAFDQQRNQYSSTLLLRELLGHVPPDAARLLGLTACDLFIPMLNFIFGQAQVPGQAAVVSLARLRQEFYGLPPGKALLLSRTLKEVAHEMGHTFGLVHCSGKSCAMSLSTNIQQVDAKEAAFCEGCGVLLREALAQWKPLVGA